MRNGRMGLRRVAGVAIACCCWVGLPGASSALATVGVEEKFTFVNHEQEFKVPAGVTTLRVEAVGSEGGTSADAAKGGVGAVVRGELSVVPGEILYVEVGGQIFDGGGESQVGNGGGASDVRKVSMGSEHEPGNEASLKSRLLIAAGGGGGGENNFEHKGPTCAGGAGGAVEASGKNGESCGFTGGGGGGGGEEAKGGAGGLGYSGTALQPTLNGKPGQLGVGGGSFTSLAGGGGGGLYGGGEGGENGEGGSSTTSSDGAGGGGGGSNLIPAGGEAEPAQEGEAASVTITYTPPPPSCTTAIGHGVYKSVGEAGRLRLASKLSTNLGEPQALSVLYEGTVLDFHLLKLERASCAGNAGERVFEGEGEAARGRKPGYALSFKLYEEGAGNIDFEAKLMKEGKVVEASGGPLTKSTEKIS